MKDEDHGQDGARAEINTAPRLDGQLCFALHRATRAITGAYGEVLAASGISYTQYLVLICLFETDGMTVGEIGARLSLHSNTLTPVVKRLEARGAVRRQRGAADERKVEVWLTEDGRALGPVAAAAQRHVLEKLAMDAPEIARLRHTLAAVADRLAGQQGGS
jgi:DNA-binding MarR family transcriptional regulator